MEMEKPRKAYKTELKPTDGQEQELWQHAGAARWAWNHALALRDRLWRTDGLSVGATKLNLVLSRGWKENPDSAWLKDVSNSTLQETFRELQAAYVHFFEICAKLKAGDPATCKAKENAKPRKDGKPFGFPRFRSRAGWDPSFTFRGTIHLLPRAIQLPKIGIIKTHEWGYLPEGAEVKSATVSRRAGRWFVSALVVEDPHEKGETNGEVIGVDLGLTAWAVASDGRRWERPKRLEGMERRLKRLQRKLARQKKGSKNRKKTVEKIGRLHWHIACARKNGLHELTSGLIGLGEQGNMGTGNHFPGGGKMVPVPGRPAAIVIEDLAVKNMLQNRHLARAISEAAWAELRRQLEYKCEWYGVRLIVADRWFASTQRCSVCGKCWRMTLADRTFRCERCGAEMDRDDNSALNLRWYGLQVLAGKSPPGEIAPGGVNVDGGVKGPYEGRSGDEAVRARVEPEPLPVGG